MFAATELLNYNDFVGYAGIVGGLTLGRVELKKRVGRFLSLGLFFFLNLGWFWNGMRSWFSSAPLTALFFDRKLT